MEPLVIFENKENVQNYLDIFTQKRLEYKITLNNFKRQKLNITKHGDDYLPKRIKLNQKLLLDFYLTCNLRAKRYLEMNSNGRWLIENRDILLIEINSLARDIDKKLIKYIHSNTKTGKDYPRIYKLLQKFVNDTETKFKQKDLINYLQEYQANEHLTLDELFTIPLFIKYILIDRICDKIANILLDSKARVDALDITEKYLNANRSKKEINNIYKNILSEGKEYAIYLFSHLSNLRLETTSYKDLMILGNNFLVTENALVDKSFRIVNSLEIKRNIRTILRLRDFDWDVVFKETSNVDKVLSSDPASFYTRMDQSSKNIYLDEIKRISRFTKVSEVELTNIIYSLTILGQTDVEKHVGYYIIDNGRKELEKVLQRKLSKNPFTVKNPKVYVVFLLLLIFLLSTFVNAYFGLNIFESILLGGFFFVPVYIIVKQTFDSLLSRFYKARQLPKLSILNNLEPDNSTVFVIPCIISNFNDIDRSLSTLETCYIGNKGENIYFCLLPDYKDADKEIDIKDNELLNYLKSKCSLLNHKYSSTNKFSFFLRKRVWCDSQNKWMGWERKRGKLLEFMNVLRNNPIHSPYDFSLDYIPKFKYLITVDEDTALTKNFIQDLVGTISHPLNRPVFNQETGLLERGFVITQPRVDFSFTTKNQSLLSKQLCDARGFDFYSQFIQEFNYDLFAEGHYTGKGVIEIDGFINQINGRFPNDTILSHDLVEGAIVGTAYLSDIVLYEGFPATVRSYLMREHRWTRGNWQIADWIFDKVKNQSGKLSQNPLSFLQRFKVFDNLIVSLFHPLLFVLLLIVTFNISSQKNLVYILLAFEFFLLNMILGIYHIIVKSIRSFDLSFILIDISFVFKNLFKRNLYNFLLFPFIVYLTVDAIIKALFRRFISHKNTLEWTTFTSAESKNNNVFWSYFKLLSPVWFGLLFLFITVLTVIHTDKIFKSLLIIWLLVPLWIYMYDKKMNSLANIEESKPFLKRIAYRTWLFFDTYVSKSSNFLPPDNTQGTNEMKVAGYTSITNIGYYLISVFSAFDLQFISLSNLLNRIEQTTTTLNKMDRFRGHFYNWYDTHSLSPSKPYFISTVDSGNFIASIITLNEGLNNIIDSYQFNNKIVSGIGTIADNFLHDNSKKNLLFGEWVENFKELTNVEIENIQELSELLLKLKQQFKLIKEKSFILNTFEERFLDKLIECFLDIYNEISSIYPFFDLKSIKVQQIDFKDDKYKVLRQAKSLKELYINLDSFISESGVNGNEDLFNILTNSKFYINSLIKRREKLTLLLESYIQQMDFSFLYSEKQRLLSIGYKVQAKRLEKYHYGILASESRLAVFLAIAKSDVPKKSWLLLDRKLKKGKVGPYLLAWSGSMFEYFMPSIFMRYTPESIYKQTFDSYLNEQINFVKDKNIPWGISESMYGEFSPYGKYRYKSFGISDSALNPHIDKRLVIAPYSSFMTVTHDSVSSIKNIEHLIEEGLLGDFGFYESVDYSSRKKEIIYAYMSHHQGMIMTSLTNALSENLITNLFHQNKMVRSVSYLLEENKPGKVNAESINLKNIRYIKYKESSTQSK